jgi:hypothetical protein
MKKGLFCVIVCTLMIVCSVVPVSGTLFIPKSSQLMKQRIVQCDGTEKLFTDLRLKLDSVTTKQEALILVNDAIVKLHEHGLLPKGMTIKQAQQFVTRCFSKSEQIQPSQNSNENTTGNTNCLVIGFANGTVFNLYPTLADFTILYNFLLNKNFFYHYYYFLFFLRIIRESQPIKFGSYASVGSRYTITEYENTSNDIHASSGWVWTLGFNGVQKWNGTFYGALYTGHTKLNDVLEIWIPVGIRGFVGMNFFSIIQWWCTFDLDVPTFYIGFAREVNMTYSPPWPLEQQ